MDKTKQKGEARGATLFMADKVQEEKTGKEWDSWQSIIKWDKYRETKSIDDLNEAVKYDKKNIKRNASKSNKYV